MDMNCYGTVAIKSAVDDNDIKEAVAGNTNFTFSLYGKIKDKNPEGNLFFSPYSISTALAMTYAGARDETEKQMVEALHFTLPGPRLFPAFGTLQKQLIQEDKSRGYRLLLANALWGQKDETFLKGFLDLTKNYYGAHLSQLDFVNETEKSRQIINSWVEEKTKNKIKGLIPPNGIDKETKLVITSAIYFKGEWKTKFKWWKTRSADFNITKKDKVKARMMQLKEVFKYCENEKVQVLELPYRGNEINMLLILPKEIEGIKKLEDTITTETLNVLLSKMQNTKVDVYLPKFKIIWGACVLNDTLTALGMPDAFIPEKADFSGMTGKKNFWISNVFHKAFVEVNEEGTEAAAGTGVVLTRGGGVSLVFRADRPFIFIIRDNRTGSILFMGRLMNPAE
jgi:serpin B